MNHQPSFSSSDENSYQKRQKEKKLAKEAKRKEKAELKNKNMQKKTGAPQFEINKRHKKFQAKQNSHTLVRNNSWTSSKDQDEQTNKMNLVDAQ